MYVPANQFYLSVTMALAGPLLVCTLYPRVVSQWYHFTVFCKYERFVIYIKFVIPERSHFVTIESMRCLLNNLPRISQIMTLKQYINS